MAEYTDFHTKYRPSSFDELIGHEVSVTRLRGMVKSGKVPGAILFSGPSSVGKTTLARALAVEINGKPIDQQRQCYMEVNAASDRSIEDMRNLVQISKFKPDLKKRIIVIDEAQAVVANAPAAAALLKPLEESGKTETLFILCSMDPSKFQSGNGKAIANRCTQFVLEPHTNADLLKQAIRIAKGEKMTYVDKEMLKDVVRVSGNVMRTLANLMQSIRDYYAGLDEKPEMLDSGIISAVLATTESSDDKLAVKVIASALAGQYAQIQKCLLNVNEPFPFANKLLWLTAFLLNVNVLNGERHSKVWFSPLNKELLASLKSSGVKPTLGQIAALQAHLVDMKSRMQAFAVGETELMSVTLYRAVKEMFPK